MAAVAWAGKSGRALVEFMMLQRTNISSRDPAGSPTICVTGLRGFPHVMGGIESHCEELLPRIKTLWPDHRSVVPGRRPYLPRPVGDPTGAGRVGKGTGGTPVPNHHPEYSFL